MNTSEKNMIKIISNLSVTLSLVEELVEGEFSCADIESIYDSISDLNASVDEAHAGAYYTDGQIDGKRTSLNREIGAQRTGIEQK